MLIPLLNCYIKFFHISTKINISLLIIQFCVNGNIKLTYVSFPGSLHKVIN